jgi:hypothetical protein
MADDDPTMAEDDTSPVDPFDAELVAYLDGELDATAARQVEIRLATDAEARAKAAALRKTYDLLDYLPRPDASPTFTTRTLDKLPSVKPAAATGSSSVPVPQAVSSSVPVALSTAPLSLTADDARPPRWGAWVAGVLVAVGISAAGGYFLSAAYHRGSGAQQAAGPDTLPISDRGVVEQLPLYAAADDLDFVRALAGSEYFGDDTAVSFDAKLQPDQPFVAESHSASDFEQLAESFKSMPPARQDAIRKLDRDLNELADKSERDRLLRVLEVYAIWLNRLAPADRESVLRASTANARLDVIRSLRERQWLDSLPSAQRLKLTTLNTAEKAELIGQWRKVELENRDSWDLIREHADDIAANRAPWPFNDPGLKQEVIEFVRAHFHIDNGKLSRLTSNEFDNVNLALREANEKQGWAWHEFGKAAYDLTAKYELWLLPPPASGDPITRMDQVPRQTAGFLRGANAKVAKDSEGKWPDFALAVYGGTRYVKGQRLPPLGPSRAREFKEPLRSFINRDLAGVLTPPQRRSLEMMEGRWPEYPRDIVKLSKVHNLSAPGMMLPGAPRQWDAIYRTRYGPKRRKKKTSGM